MLSINGIRRNNIPSACFCFAFDPHACLRLRAAVAYRRKKSYSVMLTMDVVLVCHCAAAEGIRAKKRIVRFIVARSGRQHFYGSVIRSAKARMRLPFCPRSGRRNPIVIFFDVCNIGASE